MTGRVTRSLNRHRHSYPDLWPEHINTSNCLNVKHEKFVAQARAELMYYGPCRVPEQLACGCRFIILRITS
jgi:hypothetical protein